ncbi:unnamed protein product, partial [marine sediment metagenome]
MAGIGFELRKLLQRDTFSGLLQAYGYAGVISSGPWVLSIIGILLLGLLSVGNVKPGIQISEFQVTVTYLIAVSLILSGAIQQGFTRYISDQIYLGNEDKIISTFNAALIFT